MLMPVDGKEFNNIIFCYLCFVLAMSVHCSLVVICWERAYLLSLLCVIFIVLCHFLVWSPGSGVVFDCIDA